MHKPIDCNLSGYVNLTFLTKRDNYTMTEIQKKAKKIHNPKSHAPAVYIPCWLIQVPSTDLSYQAKILYGRLSQWSNEKGIVYRSVPQLSKEIGCSKSTIDRTIKELKSVNLIGTYQPQKGGVSHFEFYDHEWMYASINKELSFKNTDEPPENTPSQPHIRCDVTPTSDVTSINIKEIKENIIERERVPSPVDNFNDSEEITYNELEKLSNESFDIFYANYPVQKAENRARCSWLSQRCYKIFDQIMESLFKHIQEDDNFKTGFAPNPDKYIQEERWKDKPLKKKQTKSEKYIADKTDDSWAKNLDKDIL